MEDHFILRLPEGVDSGTEIEVRDDGSVVYKNGSAVYSAEIAKFSCVVECYKTFDNKQFCKVSDISTLIVVAGVAGDKQALQTSGLAPPMKYAAVRRFRKKKVLHDNTESVENKIRELLEKDTRAVETSVAYHNEDDVKNIVDEIEASLAVAQRPKKEELRAEAVCEAKKETEIDTKIAQLEEAIKIAINPILKKRFVDSLNELLRRRDSERG